MTTSTNDERGLDYYDGRDDLIDVIRDTLRDAGRSPDHLELDDLALLDEFHALGRPATIALAELAGVRADARVLDVVAGRGGALQYPVPWADGAEESFLVGAGELRRLIEAAGFTALAWNEDAEVGVAIERAAADVPPASPPPRLDLSLLLPDFEER